MHSSVCICTYNIWVFPYIKLTCLCPCDKLWLEHGYHDVLPALTCLAGSLEQRLQQLREAYTFVVACDGRPPFRATKVQRQPNGRMTELLSWPSGGPSEDHVAGSALEAAPAALAAHGPQAAVVLAAAAIADAGSRMVVGGEGWHGPHLHGQGLVAPATVALGVTASSAMGSDTCGNTYSDNDYTSDGEEAPRVEGGSVSPLTLTGVGKSRYGGCVRLTLN